MTTEGKDPSGAWKVIALMLISAVLTGLASGFFFRIGTERDMAVMREQTKNNTIQIDALTTNLNRWTEQQTIFFREQATLVADLRARLNSYIEIDRDRSGGQGK